MSLHLSGRSRVCGQKWMCRCERAAWRAATRSGRRMKYDRNGSLRFLVASAATSVRPHRAAVTSARVSDQFKGYSADTCPRVQRCGLMAVQQMERLTGASRHACWRRQFTTPHCAQPHDDGLRAVRHAPRPQDILLLQPQESPAALNRNGFDF